MAWPPTDAHAHLDPAIDPADLLGLQAVIFAATRSLTEFAGTKARRDPLVVWGVGVHPARSDALQEFTVERFTRAILATPLVSEVGLDRRGHVSLAKQLAVLHQVFEVLQENPRIVSVHSAGATTDVLDVVQRHQAKGVILHWWQGSAADTSRALELGCWFSINEAELRRPRVLGRVPPERIFTETDHPYGDKFSTTARPGGVDTIEAAIARRYGLLGAREMVWNNLSIIATATGTLGLFPERLRGMLRAAAKIGKEGRLNET